MQEEKTEKRPKEPEAIVELGKAIEGIGLVEERVKRVLEFMQKALEEKPQAQLGLFWKARLICLPLFKESIAPAVRSGLWTKYLELMQEARAIKEVLEEQSAFAVEQIELAIKSLEENLASIETLRGQTPEVVLPPFKNRELEKNTGAYQMEQRELNLLNSFAARVHALRKEVIQTGMRLRIKNVFFERLSKCGDQIFPRRKELVKSLSNQFIEDVEAFVEAYFKEKSKEAPNFVLRDEIKVFQERARVLTLNTAAFSKSRAGLSSAWEALKESDKERKAEFAKKREVFDQNAAQVREKMAPFKEACAQEGAKLVDVESVEKEILTFMRGIELGRDEVKALKEEIAQAKKPLLEKAQAEKEARERQRADEKAKEKEKKERFLKEIETLIETRSSHSAEEIKNQLEQLQIESEALNLKERVTPLLRQLKDAWMQKREDEVFAQEENLDALRELLEEREEERELCKAHVEEMRKTIGGSGLDFERSMRLSDQLEEEKERLGSIDESIERIEEHIANRSV